MASSHTARLRDKRRTALRISLRRSSLTAGCLLAGAVTAHAQTFATTVVNPSTMQVAQFSTTTTAGSSTFTRPAVARPGTTIPTANSGLGSAVAFATTGFTAPSTGTYTVQLSGVTYGTDSTLANVSDYLQTIYKEPATTTPKGITNVLQDYNPTNPTGDNYNVNLTAGTAYSFVDHGYYNATDFAATPAHGASFGTANTTILFNNPGSQTTIPDAFVVSGTTGTVTPTPVSQTLNVSATTIITSFSGITIVGLQHPFIGDLLGTLTHNGVTVDLFDHTGASAANYNQGSGAKFDGGNYTFSLSGADLSAVPATAVAPDGTYKATGNAATGFDTANTANTLNSFLGMSVAGAWTLTMTDEQPDDSGSFLGFSFGINGAPASAPEPSEYAALGVGLLGLGVLALRARRRQAA